MLTVGSAHRLEAPILGFMCYTRPKLSFPCYSLSPIEFPPSTSIMPPPDCPTALLTSAQNTPPPPPTLGKVAWPPTCIRWALCCPLLMINLLLFGFIPILHKPQYMSKVRILQKIWCYHRQQLVLKWPFLHWIYHTFNSYRHQLALYWPISHLILVLLFFLTQTSFSSYIYDQTYSLSFYFLFLHLFLLLL